MQHRVIKIAITIEDDVIHENGKTDKTISRNIYALDAEEWHRIQKDMDKSAQAYRKTAPQEVQDYLDANTVRVTLRDKARSS